jgi:hypothetical protein
VAQPELGPVRGRTLKVFGYLVHLAAGRRGPEAAAPLAQLAEYPDLHRAGVAVGLWKPWEIPTEASVEAIVNLLCSDAAIDQLQAYEVPLSNVVQMLTEHAKEKGTVKGTVGACSHWLTLTQAEKISCVNRGTISRAADRGEIRGNGEKGSGRRLDLLDFVRWRLERAERSEPEESKAQVQGLIDKHVTN